MKILLTAFEPFDGEELNSSKEALLPVPEEINGSTIVKMDLPVEFGASMELLREAVRRERPDAVLCLGQAGGRKALTPERIAINVNDARIPDNAGQQPVDETIFPDGPDAYFSTLPVKSMAAAIRESGVPAEVSNTAGTFVCNQLMYGLLYFISHEFPAIRGGFLHLPYLTEQTVNHPDAPGLSRDDLTKGITAAIRAIIADRSDHSAH